MTGDREEVFGNGPWKAIGVSFIVLFILSVVVNIYQFTKTNKNGHGQQAVPDSDSLDRSGAYLSCPRRDAAVQLNVPSFG